MNTIYTTPDVKLFVTAVREHLMDLSEEEREELVGGLEGDMSDLVAERGVEALPEPADYAAELRSAAGFTAVAAARSSRPRDVRDRMMGWLDRGAATWKRWVETRDHLGLPEFAHSLRPVWWVLRALCATALIVELCSSQDVYGFTFDRAVLAVSAMVVSVLLGRGAWHVAALIRRSLILRLLLVGLNVFAILLIPVLVQRFLVVPGWILEEAWTPSHVPADGLEFKGEPVANIYPYDAQGQLLTGVQLVDRQGRRLAVTTDPYHEGTGWGEFAQVPWVNGRTKLYNVFPLAEQTWDPSTAEPVGDPRLMAPPFASLPPVTLAGVQPSVLLTPAQAAAQRAAAEKAEQAKQKKQDKRRFGNREDR